MSAFPTVELTVYPFECDAFGHLNEAAFLSLFERARWDALAQGPGMDLFRRPAPIPEDVGSFLGPRVPKGAELLRVAAGKGEATMPVEVRGEGDVILFVHGFPLDHTMWRHQLAGLTKWKRVAPDLRGLGAAAAPADSDAYSMGRYADDLVTVLDAVGTRRAVVCGLSMGGYIVFELLRRHPERIRALVLCDTKAEPDTAEGRKVREEQASLAERDGVGAVVDRLLPKLLGKTTQKVQPELVPEVREMILRSSVPGFAGALRAMRDRPDSAPDLAGIRVPTLVLGGAEDEIIAPAVMQAMAGAIPGGRFAAIPSAGHMAPLEQPLAVGRILGEFLDSLPK